MGPPRSVVTILRAAVVLLVLSGAPVAHAGGLQVTDRQGKKPAKLSTDDVPLADTAGSPADASTALKGTTGDSIYEFFATVSRGTKTFDNTLISFVPTDHRASSYVICKESIDTFPVPVDNAVRVVDMSDESFAEAESAIGPIPFFGSLYELLYVDSNGFVTFGQPQLSFGTGLVQFFSLPMISAASTDLDPSRPDGESRIFFSQDIEQGYMVSDPTFGSLLVYGVGCNQAPPSHVSNMCPNIATALIRCEHPGRGQQTGRAVEMHRVVAGNGE